MKIALTTWGYPTRYSRDANGIGSYTWLTARTLVQMGHQVAVCTTHAHGMPEVFEDEGVKVHQAPLGNLHWYLHKVPRVPPSLVTLVKIYEIYRSVVKKALELDRAWQFDVIEVGPPAAYFFPALGSGGGRRVVSTIHGCSRLFRQVLGTKTGLVDRFWDIAERRAAGLASLLISPSQFVAEFYRDAYQATPRVLPLPVKVDLVRKRSRSTKMRILANGGQGYAKGGDLVVEAMKRVLVEVKHSEISVLLALGNAAFTALKEEFPARVNLLPIIPRQALEYTYREHDVYVTASRFETFGLNLAEAMASGMAVIVSDIPPHLELTQGGTCGLAFKSGSANALAEVVVGLANNKSLREELGEAARNSVQRALDPVTVTARRVEAYRSMSEADLIGGCRTEGPLLNWQFRPDRSA